MYRLVLLWFLALLVLAGSIAGAEDKPDPVQGYTEFLKGLPKDDPKSVQKARWKYQETIAPLDQDTCAKAFLVFLDLHDCVCDKLCAIFTEKQSSLEKGMGVHRVDVGREIVESKEAHELSYGDLEIGWDGDESLYVHSIPEAIPRTFSPYLPKSLRRNLELRQIEIREGYNGDAALLISYGRLAQRIGNWEEYLRLFPNSLFRDDVLIIRASYLGYLFTGSNNTQLDPKSKDPADNIQVIYRKFMRDYPGTFSAELVRRNFDCFQKAGFFAETPDTHGNPFCDDKHCKELYTTLARSAKLTIEQEYWNWLRSTRRFSIYFRAVKQTEF